MPPSSAAPLSEISSIACRLRNPARLCSLAVCWRHYPDGGPSMAGCSLKLSSNITIWWAVGWTTNWPERKILLIIINCLVDAFVLKSEVIYANKVPKFQVNFELNVATENGFSTVLLGFSWSHVLDSTRYQHEMLCVGFSPHFHLFLKLCVCQGGGSPLRCVLSKEGVVRMKVQPSVNKHDLL